MACLYIRSLVKIVFKKKAVSYTLKNNIHIHPMQHFQETVTNIRNSFSTIIYSWDIFAFVMFVCKIYFRGYLQCKGLYVRSYCASVVCYIQQHIGSVTEFARRQFLLFLKINIYTIDKIQRSSYQLIQARFVLSLVLSFQGGRVGCRDRVFFLLY